MRIALLTEKYPPDAGGLGISVQRLARLLVTAGWRVAAAVGNRMAVEGLGTLKSNLDSGVFTAVQEAAETALTNDPTSFFAQQNALYQSRRDVVVKALQAMGLAVDPPLSTFYIWFPAPTGMTSAEASRFFVQEANVVVAPGSSYGSSGEGWLRISLTCPTERLAEAMTRMQAACQRLS